MAALLAFERGRAREQKCPAFVAARVHEAPSGIPNLGHLLPFIDQVWRIADERQAWVDLCRRALRRLIEPGDARRARERRPGLAAPFGAVDLHTAKRPHKGVEALLYEPGPISLLGQSLWCIHRRPSLSITRYAKLRHSQCGFYATYNVVFTPLQM